MRQCALDENGVLTAPEHYAFVYLTVHANFSGKFDAALFRMKSANLYWYNENGYMLDGALPAQNKTELIDGLAQVPYNNEDVNWATDVVMNNNEPRDLLYVFLVPDQYVYPLTDEASARRDGVHSNYDIVKYYSIGTYEEEDLTYTFEVVNYGSRTAKLDLTEYVKRILRSTNNFDGKARLCRAVSLYFVVLWRKRKIFKFFILELTERREIAIILKLYDSLAQLAEHLTF